MYLKEEVMNRWIVPSNLEQYDVIGAFTDLPEVEWVQRLKSVEVGDVVYIYIGKPISAIKYACEVTAINLTDDDLIVDNDEDYIRKGGYIDEGSSTHMRLKKVYEFDDSILSWPILEKCGIKGPIQGARSVPEELIAYIDNLGIDLPLSSQQDVSFEINYDKLHKLEEAFIVYEIAKHGVDPRDSLESTTLRDKNLEGYKKESFDKLHSMIEAGGPYSEILIQAFNNNNLASYHQKPSIEAIVNSDDADLLELALASLYEGNDDKSAFDEIVNVVGRNFDVVGLIFFLKDCEKYLPIRSRIFDRLFSYVDVKAALAANCSWEKYQDFISVIKDIQEDLKKKVNAEFSLLDAHSFVWILEGIHKYLDSGAQIVEHAKLGKGVVQSIDDEKITVKFADSKTPVTLLKSIAIDEGKLIFIEPSIDIDGNKASEKEDILRETLSNAEAAGNNKYIVLHSRQGKGEYLNGYINAPYHSQDGKSLHYWDILSRIKAGDILFHYCGGEIQAISTVTKDCYDRTLEPQLGETDIWGNLRRQVEFKPIILDKPLNLLEMKDVIVQYRNEKYSAFNKNGGANEGYVYNLEPKLAEIFENEIGVVKTDGDYNVPAKQSNASGIKMPSSKIYIVYRGDSYTEATSSYIWAPKQDASGSCPHHWERMTEVEPGDIILQYKDGYIKAVSAAAARCYDEDRDILTDTNENWNNEGRRIDLNTTILDEPIRVSDFQNIIIKYRKEKYSAFNKNGGANQGYLYELEPELSELFMKLVETYLPANSNDAGREEDALPEEIDIKPEEPIIEGAKKTITVNAYERDPKAKRICKDHYMKLYGRITCQVCGFDFGKIYGPEYSNRIHVHHIVPVSEIGEEYEVDPINDLIPVCPNCHMVLHLGKGISVDELKKKLK